MILRVCGHGDRFAFCSPNIQCRRSDYLIKKALTNREEKADIRLFRKGKIYSLALECGTTGLVAKKSSQIKFQAGNKNSETTK